MNSCVQANTSRGQSSLIGSAFEAVVHIIDDDENVRSGTRTLIAAHGYAVRAWPSGDSFLSERIGADRTGCVILDLRLPGTSGMDVLRSLKAIGSQLSCIVVTGHADVQTAVEAMRLGAVDFLEKPYEPSALINAVKASLSALAKLDCGAQSVTANQLVSTLTPRELDVLQALVDGGSNKTIALDLKLSPRTVEMFRAKVMKKLRASSFSDALRIAFDAGLRPR